MHLECEKLFDLLWKIFPSLLLALRIYLPVLTLQFDAIGKLLVLIPVLLRYFEMCDNIIYDPYKREEV